MSRAWMLRLALLSLGCGGIGCNSQWWADQFGANEQTHTPANAPSQTQPATQVADTQPTAEDDPLARQMQSYLDRVNSGNADLQTTTAPASTTPPGLFTGENRELPTKPTEKPAALPALAANYPTIASLPNPAVLDPNAAVTAKPRPHMAPSSARIPGGTGNLLSPIAPAPAITTPHRQAASNSLDKAQLSEAATEPTRETPKPPPAPAASGPQVELIDIRPVVNAAVNAASQPAGANQAVQGRAGSDLNALLQQLEAAVAANPQQLDEQFKLRLMYAFTGQEDKAVGPIAGADPVQADLVAAVFRALASARRSIREPAAGSSAALTAVDELRRLIAQQSPVLIAKIALVTRVNSFGDYDAVQPPRFPAGQPIHVFIYTEVGNFRSEPTPEGRLHTVLGEKVEIFDSTGKVIWQRAESNIEDRVLTPRRDFFMTLELQLPGDLPPGDYVLKVTVDDKLGATTDQQRLTFTVAAK